MNKAEDIALVSKVVLFGSEKAFRQLVEKYQSAIRRFFLNQSSGDEALSDDLAQETFIRAWLNIASFRGVAAFSTWLYRIAYNIWYDHVRRFKDYGAFNVQVIDEQHQCEQPNFQAQFDLYQSLNELKQEEKTCILLHYIEDLSVAKISSITQLAPGTVKSHLHRAREKMSIFFNREGYE